MRNIIIGTPTYDGRVDVRYTDALVNTIKTAPLDVKIQAVFLPGDAIIQKARNDLVKIALIAAERDLEVSDLVFIDSDIFWKPVDFFRLINHKVEVVGGLYRQKSKDQTITIRLKKDSLTDENGLLEVFGVGCGFLRIGINTLKKVWDASPAYAIGDDVCRSVFEIIVDKEGQFAGEDIAFCMKVAALGEKVYADTKILCGHVGSRIFYVENEVPK